MTYKTLKEFIYVPINGKKYKAKILTSFKTEKGEIKKFSMQLLALINNKWEEIRRCDTAHNAVHVHKFMPNSQSEIIKIQDNNLKKLLNEQKDDFEQNFEKWIINYLLKKQNSK